MDSKARFQGKGFAYLSAIILNTGKNSEAMKRGERKRYGISPEVRKV